MLKNKLFIIFLFSFLFLLLLVTDCFGFNVDYNKEVYTFPDVEPNNFNVCGVYNFSNNFWIIVFSFNKEPYYDSSTGYLKFSGQYTKFIYKSEDGKYYSETSSSGLASFYQISENLLYSNFDIKDKDGTVVFQKPVLQVVVELETIQELPTLVKRLMIIILPVGLIVFSAVLLIFLVRSKKWRRF